MLPLRHRDVAVIKFKFNKLTLAWAFTGRMPLLIPGKGLFSIVTPSTIPSVAEWQDSHLPPLRSKFCSRPDLMWESL